MVPEALETMLETFEAAGHEVWLVGGCVRDLLSGREPQDYDLATSASPEEIQQLFAQAVPSGGPQGTVTICQDGLEAEVTPFRTEEDYADHRHPSTIRFVKTIEEDLARRDFTINAMAWHPRRGLLDLYGGRQDLEDRIIRTVGDPDIRFQEDALRMFRAVRFAARLHFTLDYALVRALHRNAGLSKYLSFQRVWQETLQVLEHQPLLIERVSDLYRPFIPELDAALATSQNSIYHEANVLHHILKSLEYLRPFDPDLALVLLTHDLGKPETHTVSANGRDHFYRHPQASEVICRRLCGQLNFSREKTERLCWLVLHHDDIFAPSIKNVYRLCVENRRTNQDLQDLFAVQYCDIMGHSALGRSRLSKWWEFVDFFNHCTSRPLSVDELHISGRTLQEKAGLQGRAISLALDALLERCFYQPQYNREDDLLAWVQTNKEKFMEAACKS